MFLFLLLVGLFFVYFLCTRVAPSTLFNESLIYQQKKKLTSPKAKATKFKPISTKKDPTKIEKRNQNSTLIRSKQSNQFNQNFTMEAKQTPKNPTQHSTIIFQYNTIGQENVAEHNNFSIQSNKSGKKYLTCKPTERWS